MKTEKIKCKKEAAKPHITKADVKIEPVKGCVTIADLYGKKEAGGWIKVVECKIDLLDINTTYLLKTYELDESQIKSIYRIGYDLECEISIPFNIYTKYHRSEKLKQIGI